MTTTVVFDSSYWDRTFNAFESREEGKPSRLSGQKSSPSSSVTRQTVALERVLAGDASIIVS